MPKNNYVKYHKLSGAIVVAGQSPINNIVATGDTAVLYGLGVPVLPDKHRVDLVSGEVVDRHEFLDGYWQGDEYVQLLPAGAQVAFKGASFEIHDGEARVVVDQPGTHALYLSHALYKQKVVLLENKRFD